MSALAAIIARCKCGVHISVNAHRDVYLTAAQWLDERRLYNEDSVDEIPEDVIAEMIRTDTVVDVQVYPDTPIGFYSVLHFDLDAALGEIVKELCE